MDAALSSHQARIDRLRAAFVEANSRLIARLERAPDDAAERADEGRWSAAQIGWHVAAVSSRFAGLIAGDVAGAAPLPADFRERDWREIASGIPDRLRAPSSVRPPLLVTRADAIGALRTSGDRMAAALDRLDPERGAHHGITTPIVGGFITLYQVGEWAAAHVARHNKQAKQLLGA
jgi:hypothetical protein